jgi:hypothetical protein
MTAQELGAKLAPLGCTAKPSPPDTINLDVDIKPVNSYECTINGEQVTSDEYLNAQQVQHNAGLAKSVGCSFAKQFGLSDLNYVIGYNWTVSPDTASTAQSIKNTIGGNAKVVTIHC